MEEAKNKEKKQTEKTEEKEKEKGEKPTGKDKEKKEEQELVTMDGFLRPRCVVTLEQVVRFA